MTNAANHAIHSRTADIQQSRQRHYGRQQFQLPSGLWTSTAVRNLLLAGEFLNFCLLMHWLRGKPAQQTCCYCTFEKRERKKKSARISFNVFISRYSYVLWNFAQNKETFSLVVFTYWYCKINKSNQKLLSRLCADFIFLPWRISWSCKAFYSRGRPVLQAYNFFKKQTCVVYYMCIEFCWMFNWKWRDSNQDFLLV